MIYDRLVFPVFTVHTSDVELVDGILWIENQVLDDKNMKGDTLGKRRLQTPMKSIYPLKSMIKDIASLLRHQGRYYIDTSGYFFTKEKTKTAQLKYHKILRVEDNLMSSTVWLKDITFSFQVKRPPNSKKSWAQVLYLNGLPWLIYEFLEQQVENTRRKI